MNGDAGHVGWSVRLCSRFYSYRLWRLPLGLIHGLGIREIRMQLANCCPRIRRWNSIERNAITVFLPGREGMEPEIRFRVFAAPSNVGHWLSSRRPATPVRVRHNVANFSTSRANSLAEQFFRRLFFSPGIDVKLELSLRGSAGGIRRKISRI